MIICIMLNVHSTLYDDLKLRYLETLTFFRCTEANDMTPEDKPDYWVAFDYNLVEAEANKAVVHPFTSMVSLV